MVELKGRGSGPGGRVVADDVEALLLQASARVKVATASLSQAAATSATVPSRPKSDDSFNFILSNAAQSRALSSAQTKQQVPHYYLSVELQLGNLLAFRASLNKSVEQSKGVSVMDLLLKAAALAMKQVPEVNSSWTEGFVRRYHQVDINVFMGSGENLQAPLIRDVANKSLGTLSAELAAASETSGDIVAGTFSVHNLGIFGVKSFSPIILAPQAGALALGAVQDVVVPAEKGTSEQDWRLTQAMTVTLSCDHRVVDGAVGAAWLSVFKTYAENPATLLL